MTVSESDFFDVFWILKVVQVSSYMVIVIIGQCSFGTMLVGFKCVGLLASGYDTNPHIKKRRFPVVQFAPSSSKHISHFVQMEIY